MQRWDAKKKLISCLFLKGCKESFQLDFSLAWLFRKVNYMTPLYFWRNGVSFDGYLQYSGMPAINCVLWFTVKITVAARGSFLFCICQVFHANLPLLVTSAFPSSRLLLFSLKRLWSPSDPGDLHRASLVKCLGWIMRDRWGKEGGNPICALFTYNPVGRRQLPVVWIDSSRDSTSAADLSCVLPGSVWNISLFPTPQFLCHQPL